MAEAGSVTALLKLDASGFDKGIRSSIDKVNDFITIMERMSSDSSKFSKGLENTISEISNFNKELTKLNELGDFQGFKRMADGLQKVVDTTIKFNKQGSVTVSTFSELGSGIQSFMNAVGGVELKLTNVIKTNQELVSFNKQLKQSTYDVDAEFKRLQTDLMNLRPDPVYNVRRAFDEARNSLMSIDVNAFNKINTGIKSVEQSAYRMTRAFEVAGKSIYAALNESAQALQYFNNTALGTRVNFGTLAPNISTAANNITSSIEKMNLGMNQTAGAIKNTTIPLQGISVAMNSVGEAVESTSKSNEKLSQSTEKASNSARNAQGSFRGLSNVLSTLRGIGMMVVSMFAYNFLFSLGKSITETIKARSEMYSYFETMGMTTGQINTFNEALDNTVNKFQRMNKYSLGETVASLGIEFNLTTEEMTKAMDVTSMIASEYLRAGRTASEASLAVRDIMQGEFQRLSRETGVKAKDLMAAGWSGDKTDVMSLMEALEKVALSRNWDTFAEKANSLNDIVLITQNRLSEWAADMGQYVVPIVTTAFNILVTVVNAISTTLGGLASTLKLPDWAGTAILIGGLTTAVLGLIPALITARTGIGLLDIAEKGWKQSILGAVFGLNLEKNATLSSTQVLAIRLLGLNSEIVANNGVRASILAKTLALQVEEKTIGGVKKALVEKYGKEVAEQMLNQRTTSIILGKVLGLNAERVAQNGLVGAIGKKIIMQVKEIIGTEEATASEIGHTASVVAGTLAITAMVAVLALLALGFMALVAPIVASTDAMSKFNKLVKDRDSLLKEATETQAKYQKQLEETESRLDNLTKGTEVYNRALTEKNFAEANLEYANDYVETMQEAVYLAGSAQEFYDTKKVEALIEAQGRLKDAYIDLGINAEIAKDMSSSALAEAQEGADILYHALQVYVANLESQNETKLDIVAHLKASDMEDEEIAEIMQGYESAIAKYNSSKQTYMTADNLGDVITAGLSMNYWQMVAWWEDVNALWQGNEDSVNAGWEEFFRGIGHAFEYIPPMQIAGAIKNWIEGSLGGVDVGAVLTDWLSNAFLNINPVGWGVQLSQWLDEAFLNYTPVGWGVQLSEWISSAFESVGEFDVGEWWNTNVATPFMNSWNDFCNWCLSTKTWIDTTISNIFNGIVSTLVSWGQSLWSKATEVGNAFMNNIVTPISQLPSQIWSWLVSTGNYIANAMVQWHTIAHQKAMGVVNAVISYISQLPSKVYQEFMNIGSRMLEAGSQLVEKAKKIGSDIVNGLLDAMGIHSPGIIQEKVIAEFENTVSNIQGTVDSAKGVGQEFGSAITNGVTDNLTGGFVMDYRGDASQIDTINQNITSDTASTFGMLGSTVDGTINTMATNLATNYANMSNVQSTQLSGMANQNKSAFSNIQSQTNSSLNHMRDSTTQVTLQMTNAWIHMKDSIVDSANQLKTQSMAHFNTLSTNIGTFYRKLQNPSMWGAGDKVPTRYYNSARGNRGRTAVRRHFGLGYAGGSPNLPQRTSLRKLKDIIGSDALFDGWDLDTVVNVQDFLSQFDGGFGWNGWHPKHFSRIKSTTGDYNMKSPMIMHRIPTNANFHPKEFYTGRPNVGFGQFQSIAESLFSAIPYKMYYNSDWMGSWQGALNAGACNCFDGASALLALASTFGFGGYMASGTWNGIPHVYAVINGKKMDTTGWQQRRNWNGVSAGGDVKGIGQTTVNVTVDMSNSVVYGVDDLDSRIEDGVNSAMQKSINPSKIVGY